MIYSGGLADGGIQDGGIAGGTGGSLTKTGSGMFQTESINTYTGGTAIVDGRFDVLPETIPLLVPARCR